MSCVDLSYHTTRTRDKGVNFDAARMSQPGYRSTILGSMFKRIRQLHISLAAKCQLLFGAAVVLIITAALLVPWQRMEQLMEQMNERTAKTLADWAEADHVARQMEAISIQPSTRPTTGPSTAPAVGGHERAVVNLILLNRPPKGLSKFE